MSVNKPLTTGDVARLCQVSQATILNWIRDRGLNAYTTAGGHYRIRLADLQEFAARYDMPLQWSASADLVGQVKQ